MKFRKLVLCMVTGIVLSVLPTTHTYATEEVIHTEQETTVTEDSSQVTETEVDKVIDVVSATQTSEANLAEDESKTEETAEDNKKENDIEKEEVKEDKEKEAEKKDTAKAKASKKAKAKKTEKKKYSESDLRLLSALIFCEAQGESYRGKVAVGIVVMNRVRSSRFPDTLKEVIYQNFQFSPVRNGSLKRALVKYDNGKFTSKAAKDSIRAAKEVLNGKTTLILNGKETDFSQYLFFSGRLKGYKVRIGNHQFK